MEWTRCGLAVLAAGIGASLTDWLFMGILWHDKYLAYPEVWRRKKGDPAENKAVMWASLLTFLTCAIFILACAHLHLHNLAALKLAVAVWLIGPVPLLIGDALFIKIHPLIALGHSLGWLAKLLVAALAASIIL